MLLVSNPDFAPTTVTSFVETAQVAPTILQALGLDPNQLDGVRKDNGQEKIIRLGDPDAKHISTSYVERQNLDSVWTIDHILNLLDRQGF